MLLYIPRLPCSSFHLPPPPPLLAKNNIGICPQHCDAGRGLFYLFTFLFLFFVYFCFFFWGGRAINAVSLEINLPWFSFGAELFICWCVRVVSQILSARIVGHLFKEGQCFFKTLGPSSVLYVFHFLKKTNNEVQ